MSYYPNTAINCGHSTEFACQPPPLTVPCAFPANSVCVPLEHWNKENGTQMRCPYLRLDGLIIKVNLCNDM